MTFFETQVLYKIDTFNLMMFYEFVFPKADYASCVWIFRVFFQVKFLRRDTSVSDILNMDSRCARGYKTPWGNLNKAYNSCMKIFLGAQKEPSSKTALKMGWVNT